MYFWSSELVTWCTVDPWTLKNAFLAPWTCHVVHRMPLNSSMHAGTVACTLAKKRPATAGNLSASELPTGPLSAVEKPTGLYMSIFFITSSKFVINHKKYYFKKIGATDYSLVTDSRWGSAHLPDWRSPHIPLQISPLQCANPCASAAWVLTVGVGRLPPVLFPERDETQRQNKLQVQSRDVTILNRPTRTMS
jgi:hypothetical protein